MNNDIKCNAIQDSNVVEIYASEQKDYYAEISVKGGYLHLKECFKQESKKYPINAIRDRDGAPLCIDYGREGGYAVTAMYFEFQKAQEISLMADKESKANIPTNLISLIDAVLNGKRDRDRIRVNGDYSLIQSGIEAKSRSKILSPLLKVLIEREGCKSIVVSGLKNSDPVQPFKNILKDLTRSSDYRLLIQNENSEEVFKFTSYTKHFDR